MNGERIMKQRDKQLFGKNVEKCGLGGTLLLSLAGSQIQFNFITKKDEQKKNTRENRRKTHAICLLIIHYPSSVF